MIQNFVQQLLRQLFFLLLPEQLWQQPLLLLSSLLPLQLSYELLPRLFSIAVTLSLYFIT